MYKVLEQTRNTEKVGREFSVSGGNKGLTDILFTLNSMSRIGVGRGVNWRESFVQEMGLNLCLEGGSIAEADRRGGHFRRRLQCSEQRVEVQREGSMDQ